MGKLSNPKIKSVNLYLVGSRFVTLFFPLELFSFSFFERGHHLLRFYFLGFERCICCRLCDFLCPSLALELKSGCSFFCFRFALVFFISYRRCIYCGYCSLICPTDCILLSFFVFFLLVSSFFSFLSKDFLFFSSFLFFVFLEL